MWKRTALTSMVVCILDLVVFLPAVGADAADESAVRSSHLAITFESGGDGLEERIARLLSERVLRRSRIAVEVSHHAVAGVDLRVVIGRRTTSNGFFKALVERHGLTLPGTARTAPEGYAVKLVQEDGRPLLLAEGADARGLLYAAGEVLRRFEYGLDHVRLAPVDISTAPAYRFRGSSANQGGTMRNITGARGWTAKEWQDYFLDYALSGANTGYAGGAQFDFLHQFDLMTVGGCRPNQFRSEIPEEWKAGGLEGWEGTDWVCPSVPEARKALMRQWDEEFARTENHEVLRFYAGDPGGCRCPRCAPWGKNFIELCEEVAAIWRKYHPDTVVQIANQDLSNDGDRAIFDYLNEKPRTWVHGIAYGPGSNALSTYFRDELRDDLFEYPGTGPVNRYLAEILNNLPKHQTITHYSDITHWIRSQYTLEEPDPILMKAYNRRTFHTRPAAFYQIFQAIMPFSDGDIIYSEGYHDEFHQYMWNRLLWDPNRSLDSVMNEYCTYHFGKEAAPDMAAALLQLEKNLETPLAANAGIDRYYLLVKQGGWKIPPHLMAENYRWMLHMQKAALDKYFQLKLRREIARDAGLLSLAKMDPENAVSRARVLLTEPLETPDLAALKDEARRLGEESDRIIGLRNVGYFSVDKPLTSLSWTETQLQKAAAATDEERRAILYQLTHYEEAGAGGFYDDAGVPGRQPHLIRGNSYDATSRMDPSNRPSQNTIAYSLEDPRGVAFRYTELDATASYRVRVTVVAPRMRQQDGVPTDLRRLQNILADGEYIARDVNVPVYTAEQFEYDVPKTATGDSVLELTFERGTASVGLVVSEVWLLKR
jgi:hypothetical protein